MLTTKTVLHFLNLMRVNICVLIIKKLSVQGNT